MDRTGRANGRPWVYGHGALCCTPAHPGSADHGVPVGKHLVRESVGDGEAPAHPERLG